LAFTKKEKTQMMGDYETWLTKSQAVFLISYGKMTMKEVDVLRARAREAWAEMHVVKNTLFGLVMDQLGIDGKQYLEQTSLVGFAFDDAPALAKVVNDATKNETFKIKGGVLGKRSISPEEVKALASMPPLPVMRAQLLGMLSTPASMLVRTIAEPARGIASVIRAHNEQDVSAAA
jgi:large subunit ribosomal protein L10